jgi:hypothetical protein
MARERSRPVRKAKVEMLEGQLNRFIMYDDEIPHEMCNRLKKLVNKARTLGTKKWIDRMLMKRLMMTYTLMNYNVVALICQDPAYKKMSSDNVLGRIINHEINIQEANNIKNLYKGISNSKKKDIALKANKSKKKKILIETPSKEEEEEEEEEEEGKKTMKENIMKMKWLYLSRNLTSSSREECLIREKGKRSQCQRGCTTIAVRMSILLYNVYMRGTNKTMTREKSLTKTTRKTRNILRINIMVKFMLPKSETQVMRILNQKAMT